MKIKAFILFLMMGVMTHAQEISENSDITALFDAESVTGTFVLYDPEKDQYIGHNASRAKERFIPASSYKIAHTLIGLSVGAVFDVDEILPYGGKPAYLKIWEKNMSLRDAIKISNVPIYQALARRIGPDAMKEGLAKLEYGNQKIGDKIDQFWLDGPLEISAVEQVQFLGKLANEQLPFMKLHQRAVAEITTYEKTDDYTLHAKSGLTTFSDPDTGWWVGWVTRNGIHYPFALNIDVMNDQDIAKREALAKASLRILGLL
ncbi:class D beta-lactamase [Pseudemcibacter aquimaris]|uniref:class D beta-lactamase n=1 Tax=Pseudemcibacter aquimaris TaxID=2857064 RepID=UPI0020125C0E|nr:class D beta-lactamase [Pseudemcibacter aquimaris]MCC3862158.1 class D beta-lactamase [Pseudemcibacter aquimaris]WDU58911.1 class D beta-lactamase [Pseudemcibacter aquimaris]